MDVLTEKVEHYTFSTYYIIKTETVWEFLTDVKINVNLIT